MSQAPPTTVEFVADFAPTARRPLWPLLVAGALLALAAIVATLQAPYRDAYGYGARGWGDWLIRPLEVNPELRLPRVEGDLKDIAFSADGQTGFALGEGGAILQTGNGGLDWRGENLAGAPDLADMAVSAEGELSATAGEGGIRTWRPSDPVWRLVHAAPAGPDSGGGCGNVQVSDDATKLRAACLDLSRRFRFVRSNDGGKSWIRSNPPAPGVFSILAFDGTGQIGFARTASAGIFQTSDGGVTWNPSIAFGGSPSFPRKDEAASLELGALITNDAPLLLSVALEVHAPEKPAQGTSAEMGAEPSAAQKRKQEAAAADQRRMQEAYTSERLRQEAALEAASVDAAKNPSGATQGPPSPTSAASTPPAFEYNPAPSPATRRPRPSPIQTQTVRSSSGKALETRQAPLATPTPAPTPSGETQPGQAAPDGPSPILTLAAIPGSRTIAGIRMVESIAEIFVGDNDYPTNVFLDDLAMASSEIGWATGAGIWATKDGANWRRQFVGDRGLKGIASARDGKHAWAVGVDGTMVATVDGGDSWFHQLRRPGVADPTGTYWRFPAPWFYLALIGFGGFVAHARRPLAAEPQPGVSAMGSTDAPAATLADDKLQFAPLARGISRYLRNCNTQPPLTLAISGEWGSGKSSLMRMVCEDLGDHGNHPVWFNAWHHQDEEQLLAALLAAIRDKALPPWLSLDGLKFRLKLFLIRARRKLVATLALVAIASFILAVLNYTSSEDWAGWAGDMARLFPGKEGAENAGLGKGLIQGLTGIAGLAGLITTVTGISRALRAFGANPAVLLTSTIDNFKLRDAAAQVHFRTRFQRQFDDVTEALPYPLVIVIDDLDRCRPETVLQVMESVNFLMTSGKCFVLFGMSTPRVQAALALSFKDIAQEFVEIDPDIATPATPEDRIQAERVNRLNYAGDYLQKLINLDIRVPAREDIAPHLLLTRSRSPEEDEQFAAARRWFGLLWPLALVAAVAGAAWWEGSQLFAPDARDRPVEQAVSRAPATQATVRSGATNPRPAEPAPAPAATSSPASKPVEVIPGQSGGRNWPMIVLLGGLLAVVAALQYRRRKTDEAVADTDAFNEALRVWTPIVARRTPSPRAIKRFGNRLRYLAMLQQAEEAGPNGGGLLSDWLARRFAANDAGDPPQPSSAKVDVVAEHRIVALGAIHAVFGDRDWREWLTLPRPPGDASPYNDVDKAITAYTACGWRWPPTSQELDAFERSLKGIRLGGEVAVLDGDGKSTDSPGPASSAAPGPQPQPKRPLRKEQL